MAYEGDTITAANPYNSSTGQFGLPSSGGLSGSSVLGLGALGAGAVGLGAILGEGESPLPSEFSTVTNTQVPWLQSAGQWAENQGQQFAGAGAQALQMAQNGQLTPQQQAQLSLYQNKLGNQTNQTFASMGRNPNQDTTAISAAADNDAKMIAASQAMIQSTIQLGLGETQAGLGFTNEGIQANSAASNELIEAGNAQLKNDQAYNTALTGAFSAIGQLAGTIGGAAIGGPVGASVGGAAGKMLGGAVAT